MKKINSKQRMLLVFSLLFLSVLFFLSNPASAEGLMIYVDDDADPGWYNETHVRTIQDAVDNASVGASILIIDGNYTDTVYINKSVNINGQSITGVICDYSEDEGNGNFFEIWSDNVRIENLTVSNVYGAASVAASIWNHGNFSVFSNLNFLNNDIAILINDSNNILVSDNEINGNSDGIHIIDSNNVSIVSNYINNNVNNGVYLFNSNDNLIFHNYIINTSEIGIQIDGADSNMIFDNYLDNIDNAVGYGTNNKWNISKQDSYYDLDFNIIGGEWFGGNYWNDYIGFDNDSDGLGNNPYDLPEVLIDYLPLMYNYDYIEVNDDADPTWYDETHVYSIPEAVEKANEGASIFIYNGEYSDGAEIDKSVNILGESTEGVICGIGYSSDYGIFFDIFSDYVRIQNLTVRNINFDEYGIAIRNNGNFSLFSNLILADNYNGLYIQNSNDVYVHDNLLMNNDNSGIYLLNSEFINITNNNIYGIFEGLERGIILENSNNNTIFENFIENNWIGIEFQMVIDGDTNNNDNTIFNNYFQNWMNVEYVGGLYTNIWNITQTDGVNIIGGPYIGGNYWNDYIGFDNNSDGLGDSPHVETVGEVTNVTDFLPLIPYFNVYDSLPADGSINLEPGSLTWMANLSYFESFPPFGVSVECSNGQNVSLFGLEGPILTNNVSIDLTGLQYGTTYTVWVNVTGEYISRSFVFTFTIKNKPQEKKVITNTPPVALAGGPYAGYPNEEIYFYGGASYDPDGDIVSYKWSLGDGTSAQESSTIHSYANAGTYTITLTVTDDEGATGSSSTRVVIIKPNNPPELLSSVSTNPGEYTAHLMITASDKDGDDISCSISWGDGESTSITLSDGQTTTQTHSYPGYGSYTIRLSGNDGNAVTTRTHTISIISEVSEYEQTGAQGFSNMISTNESFIENQIGERSIIGSLLEKNYVIPAATILSIILLFLLNFLVEFLSDYSSEKALDLRENKKSSKVKKKTKVIQPHKFLSNREIFSVIITTILLTFVLSWTWVPDMESFWGFFTLTLLVVAGMIVLRESLRCYLCHKQKLASEFYVWPVGSIMMIVSTFLGNTFSLAANHNYDDEGDIRKCGKVTFTVAIVLYLIVLSSFIANILYPSLIFQMIVIATVLNLFIDLFPLKPMDGYEIRKWNFFIWALFYALVIVSYVVVYFNLYP